MSVMMNSVLPATSSLPEKSVNSSGKLTGDHVMPLDENRIEPGSALINSMPSLLPGLGMRALLVQ